MNPGAEFPPRASGPPGPRPEDSCPPTEPPPERVDLARLVRAAAAGCRPPGQAGGALTVDAPKTPVWVRGDEARLRQALTGLLSAAGAGHAGLEVDGAGQAVLTVAGVPPRARPRLEEALREAGPEGLKALVELYGGRVEATSPAAGLVVRLPAEAEPPALSAPPPDAGPAGRRLRVVVVEDNKDAADTLRLLLEVFGYEARVAYTGTDGLATAVTWRPDAVLSDVGLPGLCGLDLAAQLRRHPATAGALLVGISGYGSDEDRRRARQAGFDHYLVKPADPADIQQILASQAASMG